MNNRKLFNDKNELDSSMINFINLFIEKNFSKKEKIISDLDFVSETLKINVSDYYSSNVVARSSKTMLECKKAKINFKSTGTDG